MQTATEQAVPVFKRPKEQSFFDVTGHPWEVIASICLLSNTRRENDKSVTILINSIIFIIIFCFKIWNKQQFSFLYLLYCWKQADQLTVKN